MSLNRAAGARLIGKVGQAALMSSKPGTCRWPAPVPVPLLPWPALLLLGNLRAGLGAWQLARRRKTE